MKKRKLLLSTLAAAVFVTGAGALVACGDVDLPENGTIPTDVDKTCTVTFVPGADAKLTKIQGNSLTTGKDGKLTGTMPEAEKNENNENYEFTGWGLAAGQTVPTLTTSNFNKYVFNGNTPVYAVFKEKDDPGPGPVVDEEYDITFVAGEGGTLSGETSVKTSEGIAAFPTPIADTDWEFDYWVDGDGSIVTTSTVFTKSTTVTAHFTEVEPQPPQPPQPSGDVVMSVGGTASATSFTKKPENELDTANKQTGEYYAANVLLNQGDVISFTVNDTAVNLWRKHDDNPTQDARNKLEYVQDVSKSSPSLTVSEGGTYTVSITNWNNAAEWVVWVGDPNGGEEGGDEDETPVVGMKRGTTAVEGTKITPDAGVEYQYKFELTLEANETISFTIDGTDVADIWLEGCQKDCDCPAGQAHVAGKAAITKVNTHTANFQTLAEGTYTFYFKCYGPNDYGVWAATPAKPEGGEEGGDEDETPVVGMKRGATAVEGTKVTPDAGVEYQYKFELTLEANETISFTIDGTDVADIWLEGCQKDCDCPAGQAHVAGKAAITKVNTHTANFQTLAEGTYTFYFKCWGPNDYGVWAVTPVKPEGGEEGGDEDETPVVGMKRGATAVEGTKVTPDAGVEYQYKFELTLEANETISFTIDGTDVADFWLTGCQANCDCPAGQDHVDGKAAITKVKTHTANFQTLAEGTYTFYFKCWGPNDYGVWAVTPVKPEGGEEGGDTDGMVAVVNGNQENNKPNVYVIKKGNTSQGYFATYTGTNGDGYDEYSVTVTVNAGDELAIYVPSWGENLFSELNPYTNSAIAESSGGYIVIKTAGTYTFYFQTKWGSDRVYIG